MKSHNSARLCYNAYNAAFFAIHNCQKLETNSLTLNFPSGPHGSCTYATEQFPMHHPTFHMSRLTGCFSLAYQLRGLC